jgi:hypothetical protein
VPEGAGVDAALESEALTAGDGSFIGLDGVGAEGVDDEIDFARDDFDAVESEGKLASSAGDNFSLTSFDFEGLAENLEVIAAAAGGILVVELAMAMGIDGSWRAWSGARGFDTVADCQRPLSRTKRASLCRVPRGRSW